jgi:hypothetical protein
MHIPGYEVYEQLSCNAWFRLSRGRCQGDGSPELLKTPRAEPTPVLAWRLLAHEYDTTCAGATMTMTQV